MSEIFENGKRYFTLDAFLKQKFGCKIAKISLNGGFTCPNRDGTKSFGGCIYCSDKLSGEFAGNPEESVHEQFVKGKAMMAKKWKHTKYMPYFQAGTNTYAPTAYLKKLYEAALIEPDVVGLSIATRPDCITDETLAYLSELNTRTFLTVELGLQTTFDDTGIKINRHTTYQEFLDCFYRLQEQHIAVCVHLINGLPGEDTSRMLENVKRVAALSPWAIKLHLLHIIKGTACEKLYREGKLSVMEQEAYIELICRQLRHIPSNIVIQRLTGDGARSTLVAPLWSLKKFEILNSIDRYMLEHQAVQGDMVQCD